MKTCMCILMLWLVAMPETLSAGFIFTRSGQKAVLPVRHDYSSAEGPVTLWAFGKQWGEQTEVKDGVAEFVAPTVRVPVVFQLKSGHDVQCEMIVYPDRHTTWDEELEFIVVGASIWLKTWAKAMDMPAEFFENLHGFLNPRRRFQKQHRLLILAQPHFRDAPETAWRLACEYETNVLWLGRDWYANNMVLQREVIVSPKQTSGPLADLQTQDWHRPPAFNLEVLRVLNRQTWISGSEYPLVEELRVPEAGRENLRVVWSYLPWPQQLGRNEVADMLFIRLLTEVAKGAGDRRPLDGRWRLLYPAAEEIKADQRPVLAAALKSVVTDPGNAAGWGEIRICVLDLRGKTPPPHDLFDSTSSGAITAIETRIGTDLPLLILGDNPILDTWKWLGLDRTSHRSSRPGVVWLPDSSLPPSMESQLRLMQLFTGWNIPLGGISQEGNNEER